MPPKTPETDEDLDDVTLPEENDDEGQDGGDAGQDDDQGGDDSEAGQEPEADEAQEGQVDGDRKPGRASRAVQEAKRIAREAQAEKVRLEQELAALRAERAAPKVDTEAEEKARLALMTAEERVEYRLEKAERDNKRQLQLMQFQMADSNDKAAFETKGAYDPRYKKYASEVEALLAQERRQGRDFPRETILRFVLGGKVMDAKKDVKRQQAQGRDNIRRQQTRPSGGQSDVPARRGRVGQGDTLADLERRLEGVQI